MHIPQFIETIRVVDGQICLEELHRERMLLALKHFHLHQGSLYRFLRECPLHLYPAIRTTIVDNSAAAGVVYALRLVYDAEELHIRSYAPYHRRRVQQLQPICLPPDFSYAHKVLDRALFEADAATLPPDTIPIYYRKGGVLTDTSYTNIVLECRGRLYTPEHPLLAGVQRQHLLHQGRITPAELTLADLVEASRLYLINALMPLEDCLTLTTSVALRNI